MSRHPGDAPRLSGEDVEQLYNMYTRSDGLRSVQEAEDRRQYVARDQDEVRMMFLSMRATRDAARRGEHVAGWRLDAGRGAILRECPAVSLRSAVSASPSCQASSRVALLNLA
jgi:hypothetical protein